MRKGIILAGGHGTRLYPITKAISKQLLPIYNKPMIYYPLSTLMMAGIKDFLVIATEKDLHHYMDLLGTGVSIGINIQYAIQDNPQGIAQSLIIAKDFIKEDNIALILGDNLFHGHMSDQLIEANNKETGATLFAATVTNPQDYGVITFYPDGAPMHIIEKPKKPGSHFAVTGLYFYDNKAIDIAENLFPSARGELEITDVNQCYLDGKYLECKILPRGTAWLDTGTHESFMQASQYVETVEKRTGLKIGCLEEIAYRKGYIDKGELLELARDLQNSDYGRYLFFLTQNEE